MEIGFSSNRNLKRVHAHCRKKNLLDREKWKQAPFVGGAWPEQQKLYPILALRRMAWKDFLVALASRM
jgi:hypothetical protein